MNVYLKSRKALFYVQNARFSICHSELMKIEDLVLVRNILNSQEGRLLLDYLSDYISSLACTPKEASEIKGMCELLHQIKAIPQYVEDYRKG